MKRWVPDGRVAAAVMKSVEPKVLAPREAGDAARVEAGEAVLVTVWVTAAPGVAFGGREVTRAVGGPGEAETLIEAAMARCKEKKSCHNLTQFLK